MYACVYMWLLKFYWQSSFKHDFNIIGPCPRSKSYLWDHFFYYVLCRLVICKCLIKRFMCSKLHTLSMGRKSTQITYTSLRKHMKDNCLKMLGLYLYSLIIGHKSCNVLSMLNKLSLQRELQNVVTMDKRKNTTTTKQKIKQKPLPEPGIEPGTSCTQSGCITTAPPSQLRLSIVVKLFNCFDTMGRNINKQSRICGPHIFNKFIFSVIFLLLWINIFGSFSCLRK